MGERLPNETLSEGDLLNKFHKKSYIVIIMVSIQKIYMAFKNSAVDNDTMTKVLLRAECFIYDTYHNCKIDEIAPRQKHFHGREQTAPSSRARTPMGQCSLGAIVTRLTIVTLDSRDNNSQEFRVAKMFQKD